MHLQSGSILMTLITFLIILAIILPIAIPITKRKGKSTIKTVILHMFIPIVGFLYLWWIVSLTDKSVLDRLEACRKKNKQNYKSIVKKEYLIWDKIRRMRIVIFSVLLSMAGTMLAAQNSSPLTWKMAFLKWNKTDHEAHISLGLFNLIMETNFRFMPK